MEAGLTLSELAGREVTRQQVHHIETGRARPSMRTLSWIASRTRKPLAFFLADASSPRPQIERYRSVDKLEAMVLAEEWEQVLPFAERLLSELDDHRGRAEVRLCAAQACCALGQPSRALELLEPALKYAERVRDEWLAVDCLDWRATALALLGDSSALRVAQQALRRCRKLDPAAPATESRLLEHIGFICVTRGSWRAAVQSYRLAAQAEAEVLSLRRAARAYLDLQQAHERLGNQELAARYGNEALALYKREHDLRGLAGAENNLALLLMRDGDLDGAEEMLESARAHFAEAGVERWAKSLLLLSFGDLNLRRGDLDRADAYLAEGMTVAQGFGEKLAEARIRQMRGQLASRRRDWAAADAEYTRSLELFARLGAAAALRECHLEFGESLRQRPEPERAIEQFAAAAHVVDSSSRLEVPNWLTPTANLAVPGNLS
jgi:tetratricopeptide (TPR) repeat protein